MDFYYDVDDDSYVGWYVGAISTASVFAVAGVYIWMMVQYRKNYWNHGVRLPSRPQQAYWYIVTISVGCRPWAGHEGDVYIRLIGTSGEGKTFLVNGESYARLHEADAHYVIYPSSWLLGEIEYVLLMCGATNRKKRWFLSSVQVKLLADDRDNARHWYFPYHEWIEVFLDPVKVTLCGVDPYHDLNRRILLGWLSRGVSDFHLWLSTMGPVKYSRFRRAERFLCCGTHLIATSISCIYLNIWVPELGSFVLGIYASAGAAAPVYLAELIFRLTSRRPKVVVEDPHWYKGGKNNIAVAPVSYDDQLMIHALEGCDVSKIACDRDYATDEQRLGEFQAYKDIMRNDMVFWKWLTDGGKLGVTSFLSINLESYHSALECLTEPVTWQGKLKKRMRDLARNAKKEFFRLFPWAKSHEDEYIYDEEGIFAPSDTKKSTVRESIKPTLLSSTNKLQAPYRLYSRDEGADDEKEGVEEGEEGGGGYDDEEVDDEDNEQEEGGEDERRGSGDRFSRYLGRGIVPEKKWINLRQKFFAADPTSLWRVDSDFSIFSLNMYGVDFDRFSLLESMPVSEFDRLRQGKRPLLGWGTGSDIWYTTHDLSRGKKEHVYRRLVDKVEEILLPDDADHLTYEEGQLVSMIYFDLNTRGYQWCKPGIPDELFTHQTDIRPATDWMKLDIASKQDFNDNWKPFDFYGRSDKHIKQRMTIQDLEHKYPEPIPRLRIFSMLMFRDYARRLADAYMEMTEHSEMHSCLAELFAMFAESKEGPALFAEACLEIAPMASGRQALCHLMSCARKSCQWGELISDLSQRLRYQGDNVKRIRDKYGFETKCELKTCGGAPVYEGRCFDAECGETCKPAAYVNGQLVRDKNSMNKCVYYELVRVMTWSKKLEDLDIPDKDCPLGQLSRPDLTKLSRFFRAMIYSAEGCVLLAELLQQLTARGKEGCTKITRVLKYITQQDDGVERLIGFHRQLGESGRIGRRLLLRLYNAVKRQPGGIKVLTRIAEYMGEIPTGKMLIEDLQRDGKKAHVMARRIKSEIHRNLYPLVKSTAQHIRHIVLRLNEMARCMLTAADHAREVLDGEGDLAYVKKLWKKFPEAGDNLDEAATLKQKGVHDPDCLYKSKLCCCRNYKELLEKINAEKKGPEEPPAPKVEKDKFKYSPDSSPAMSCIYMREPLRSNKLISELWQPIDEREHVNIYERFKEEKKREKEEKEQEKKKAKEENRKCVGVKAPCCKRLKICLAKERNALNSFYLQSKDYERFYMNFSFRQSGMRQRSEDIRGRLGGTGAEPVRSQSSLAWEAKRQKKKEEKYRRSAYKGLHNKHTDLPDIAGRWGRKVVYDDSEVCEDDDDVDDTYPCLCEHGECIYSCLICSIARQISDAEHPDQVLDIITDQTKLAPRHSTSKLPPFPDYKKKILKKPIRPQEVEHAGYARQQFKRAAEDRAADSARENEYESAYEDLSSGKRGDFPPGQELRKKRNVTNIGSNFDDESSSETVVEASTTVYSVSEETTDDEEEEDIETSTKPSSFNASENDDGSAEDEEESTDKSESSEHHKNQSGTPFPSAGCCHIKVEEMPCPCKPEQAKFKIANNSKRLLAMYTKSQKDEPDPDTNNAEKLKKAGCGEKCSGKAKMPKRPSRPYPITAQNIEIAETVKLDHEKPISPVVAEALRLIKEREENGGKKKKEKPKVFPSPIVPTKKASATYWAENNDSVSDFSQPELKYGLDINEYCHVCGGVARLRNMKSPIYAYRYLVNHEKGKRQERDPSVTTLCSKEGLSDEEAVYDRARGCCSVPGCRNKLPRGTRLRNLPKKQQREREKRYWKTRRKIEKQIANSFEQWYPPDGRHKLPHVAHKDEMIIYSDEDDDDDDDVSFETALSCLREDDSSITNSIDSMGKLVRKSTRKPVITKQRKLKMLRNYLEGMCDMHKLPRFECCRLDHKKWETVKEVSEEGGGKRYINTPRSCICHLKSDKPPCSKDFESSPPSSRCDLHSVCSDCRIRIGTQQNPPCMRYLLPLKALRCYEEALRKFAKAETGQPLSVADSGISINTAADVLESDSESVMPYAQQQTVMDLLGLSKRPGTRIKAIDGNTTDVCSYISARSSSQTSSVCCHVKRARQIPVLHLQGFGCEPVIGDSWRNFYQPLSLEWWKRHDIALRLVQRCADELVRFRVLIAQTRKEAITEHEKTCRVCVPRSVLSFELDLLPQDDEGTEMIGGTVLGNRYSEMLPVVWRPIVRDDGRSNRPLDIQDRNLRFYRELIQAAVESTRILILTPDIKPPKTVSQAALRKKVYGHDSSDTDNSEYEARNTSAHITRLAHFRATIKSLNELLKKVITIKNAKLISNEDVIQAAKIQLSDYAVKSSMELCSVYGIVYKEMPDTDFPKTTIADSLTEYIKAKMCGSVNDCREMLNYPWQIPVEEQHVAGRFLSGVMEKLRESAGNEDLDGVTLDDAVDAIVESFIGEAIFKATTQTCIQRAVLKATRVKQYMAYLECITRLCLAKLLEFGEVVDYSIYNTRRVVKLCMEAVEEKVRDHEFTEGWWNETEKEFDNGSRFERKLSTLLHTGRDNSRATLDDVLIGFERLRRYIRYDLSLANIEMLSIENLMDKESMELFEGVGDETPEKKSLTCYDAWTESEVVLREEENRKERDRHRNQQEKDIDESFGKSSYETGSDDEDRSDETRRSFASSNRSSVTIETDYDSDEIDPDIDRDVYRSRRRRRSSRRRSTRTSSIGRNDSRRRSTSPRLSDSRRRSTSPRLIDSRRRSTSPRLIDSRRRSTSTRLSDSRRRSTSPRLSDSRRRSTSPRLSDSRRRSTITGEGGTSPRLSYSRRRSTITREGGTSPRLSDSRKRSTSSSLSDSRRRSTITREGRTSPRLNDSRRRSTSSSLSDSRRRSTITGEGGTSPRLSDSRRRSTSSNLSDSRRRSTISSEGRESLSASDSRRQSIVTSAGKINPQASSSRDSNISSEESISSIMNDARRSTLTSDARRSTMMSNERGSQGPYGIRSAMKGGREAALKGSVSAQMSTRGSMFLGDVRKSLSDGTSQNQASANQAAEQKSYTRTERRSLQSPTRFERTPRVSAMSRVQLEEEMERIRETVLVRDEATHEVVDVIVRDNRSRAEAGSPYPVRRVNDTMETSPYSRGKSVFSKCLLKARKNFQNSNSTSFQSVHSTDATDYVTCSSSQYHSSDGEGKTAGAAASYHALPKEFTKTNRHKQSDPLTKLSTSIMSLNEAPTKSLENSKFLSRSAPGNLGTTSSSLTERSSSDEWNVPMNSLQPSAGVYDSLHRKRLQSKSSGKSEPQREQRLKSHRFESVFRGADLESEIYPEDRTKKALQTKQGKGMLREIFGKPMTPKEMIDTYHHNIRALIKMQSGQILPHWMSEVTQILLIFLCLAAGGYAIYLGVFIGLTDEILYWSIPVAIFTFAFILEPLKCLLIAYIFFLRRKRPPFYNCPLFIKSSPSVINRGSALRPKIIGKINRKDISYYHQEGLTAADYEEGLYRIYCENKSRPNCGRHQRRILPAIAESDVSLDLDMVEGYGEVEQAKPSFRLNRSDSILFYEADETQQQPKSNLSGGELYSGVAGARRDRVGGRGSYAGRRRNTIRNDTYRSLRQSRSMPSRPGKTKIVWCSQATSDDGKPSSAPEMEARSDS